MLRNQSAASRAPLAIILRERPATSSEPRRVEPCPATDILTIGENPIIDLYLGRLFERFGWTFAQRGDARAAVEFLSRNATAVAVCQPTLPDGTWQDALERLSFVPDAPSFVLVSEDCSVRSELVGRGGFDLLHLPLREDDVVWTVATAWHDWMKRCESRATGGALCSDA